MLSKWQKKKNENINKVKTNYILVTSITLNTFFTCRAMFLYTFEKKCKSVKTVELVVCTL